MQSTLQGIASNEVTEWSLSGGGAVEGSRGSWGGLWAGKEIVQVRQVIFVTERPESSSSQPFPARWLASGMPSPTLSVLWWQSYMESWKKPKQLASLAFWLCDSGKMLRRWRLALSYATLHWQSRTLCFARLVFFPPQPMLSPEDWYFTAALEQKKKGSLWVLMYSLRESLCSFPLKSPRKDSTSDLKAEYGQRALYHCYFSQRYSGLVLRPHWAISHPDYVLVQSDDWKSSLPHLALVVKLE